jgi:hypothetical protein
MFIERARSKIPPRSSGAKRSQSDVPLPETLRSDGPRTVFIAGIYKHSAPLEPDLVATLAVNLWLAKKKGL